MNTFSEIPLIIKIFGALLGAVFALTLTGDIDGQGKLHINPTVIVKLAFSAFFGFVCAGWLIETFGWSHYSYVSQSFLSMMCSVFGMTIVGTLYQSYRLTFTDKTLHELISEIKAVYKALIK